MSSLTFPLTHIPLQAGDEPPSAELRRFLQFFVGQFGKLLGFVPAVIQSDDLGTCLRNILLKR